MKLRNELSCSPVRGVTRLSGQQQACRLLGVVLVLVISSIPASGASPVASAARPPLPVLAYYYIWFNPQSWERAKTDLPILGPYSSDDRQVMRQHIKWAKNAGIDGFIVSWKSTTVLNRRLERLIEIADAEDFKLSIVYQGLDFARNPLPIDRIAADLDYFIEHYANDKAFDMFERPMLIWSGTWKFSQVQVAQVTGPRRSQLLILASERNSKAYQRLVHVVDGDAYYWSSVDPETFPQYEEKLNEMGKAVHANRGLWIAPAAVGFDTRLTGGTRIVDRKDGTTLREQMAAAISSTADAVGVISWNEFTENSYVEPSRNYGERYLQVLAEIRQVNVSHTGDFDSDAPSDIQIRPGSLAVLSALVSLILVSLAVIARRGLRNNSPNPPSV
jgi:Glycosyl hydrolase family 71